MKNENDEEFFDDFVYSKLGYYVYVLIDPETKIPFYIGKGGGREGSGNRRILDHFKEARSDKPSEEYKVRMIRYIWREGRDVPWKIIRWGLKSEGEALSVESALIDMLRGMDISLTNKQSGHGSAENGIKSPTDLRTWLAPKLDLSKLPASLVKRPIFLFNIGKGVKERKDSYCDDELSILNELTCQYWRVSEELRAHNDAIAVGCINGITRTALEIKEWHKPKYNPKDERWEIVPRISANPLSELNALMYKNIKAIIEHCKGYWQRGNYIVFIIDDSKKVTIMRGSRHRTLIVT